MPGLMWFPRVWRRPSVVQRGTVLCGGSIRDGSFQYPGRSYRPLHTGNIVYIYSCPHTLAGRLNCALLGMLLRVREHVGACALHRRPPLMTEQNEVQSKDIDVGYGTVSLCASL